MMLPMEIVHRCTSHNIFKVGMPVFQPLSLKSWPFEASEDIMTKFISQVLYIIRIKY